jgi:hypothetical protein
VMWPSHLQSHNATLFYIVSTGLKINRDPIGPCSLLQLTSSSIAISAPMVANHVCICQASQVLQETRLRNWQEQEPNVGPHHDAKSQTRPACAQKLVVLRLSIMPDACEPASAMAVVVHGTYALAATYFSTIIRAFD